MAERLRNEQASGDSGTGLVHVLGLILLQRLERNGSEQKELVWSERHVSNRDHGVVLLKVDRLSIGAHKLSCLDELIDHLLVLVRSLQETSVTFGLVKKLKHLRNHGHNLSIQLDVRPGVF